MVKKTFDPFFQFGLLNAHILNKHYRCRKNDTGSEQVLHGKIPNNRRVEVLQNSLAPSNQ